VLLGKTTSVTSQSHHELDLSKCTRISKRSQAANPTDVAGTRTNNERHGFVFAGVSVSAAIPGNVPKTNAVIETKTHENRSKKFSQVEVYARHFEWP